MALRVDTITQIQNELDIVSRAMADALSAVVLPPVRVGGGGGPSGGGGGGAAAAGAGDDGALNVDGVVRACGFLAPPRPAHANAPQCLRPLCGGLVQQLADMIRERVDTMHRLVDMLPPSRSERCGGAGAHALVGFGLVQ